MYSFKSNDNKVYSVEKYIIDMCTTLKDMLEDCPNAGHSIPLDISSEHVEYIIDMCQKIHPDLDKYSCLEDSTYVAKTDEKRKKEGLWIMQEWEQEFCDKMSDKDRFLVMNAAQFLNNKYIVDIIARHTANIIFGKTPDEIRERFNIKQKPVSKEEQDKLLSSIKWEA